MKRLVDTKEAARVLGVTPKKYRKTAQWRKQIVERLLKRLLSSSNKSKSKTIKGFSKKYGISRATLYVWVRAYKSGGINALVPHYRGYDGIPRISGSEEECLKDIFKNNLTKRVDTAILIVKYFLTRTGNSSPSSLATLRRWTKRYLKNGEYQ